jgi:uncharacterized protein DUF5946
MMSEQDAYNMLCAYTLNRRDAKFIHQHVVDAFLAQHADERTKPMGLTFALLGLYLFVERGFTGKQVQRVHVELARQKRAWLMFTIPADRGAISAVEVMHAAEGPERDRAIHAWCASVWAAFAAKRETLVELLRPYGILR